MIEIIKNSECACVIAQKFNTVSIARDLGTEKYIELLLIKNEDGYYLHAEGEDDAFCRIHYCPMCGRMLSVDAEEEVFFNDFIDKRFMEVH